MSSFKIPKDVPSDKVIFGFEAAHLEQIVQDPAALDAFIEQALNSFPNMTPEKFEKQKALLLDLLDQQSHIADPMAAAEHAFKLFAPMGEKQVEVSANVLPKLCKEVVPQFIADKLGEMIFTLESYEGNDENVKQALKKIKKDRDQILSMLAAIPQPKPTGTFKA